jgi:hypothetical protein
VLCNTVKSVFRVNIRALHGITYNLSPLDRPTVVYLYQKHTVVITSKLQHTYDVKVVPYHAMEVLEGEEV